MSRARADGLRLAVTTFTVWPSRGPVEVDRATAGRAMRLAPGVSLLVSLPAVVVLLGAWTLLVGPPPPSGLMFFRPTRLDLLQAPGVHHPLASGVAAVLAVGSVVLLTRALHLDGLADTVDGLGSYRTPEKALELMRRGGSGPFGVAAVVLDLALQVGALALLVDRSPTLGAVALVVAAATGRTAVTLACTPRTPAARPDGLGALVAGTVTRRWALGVTTVVVALAATVVRLPGLLLGGADPPTVVRDDDPLPPALLQQSAVLVVAAVVALALSHALRAHCVRRFGGMTGDVLGALVETTTTAVLLLAALAVPALR